MKPEHAHYFKTSPFDRIDVYRVLLIFGVTDPCIQHAVKKLLVPGERGSKDEATDIQEAIDSLERWKEMRVEESDAERMRTRLDAMLSQIDGVRAANARIAKHSARQDRTIRYWKGIAHRKRK